MAKNIFEKYTYISNKLPKIEKKYKTVKKIGFLNTINYCNFFFPVNKKINFLSKTHNQFFFHSFFIKKLIKSNQESKIVQDKVNNPSDKKVRFIILLYNKNV